jgi:hypothetical protein
MVNVFITVDTESSLGGAWENPAWRPVSAERAILGRIGSREYGVPLIMDILEENGLRGTFFTEVFASEPLGAAGLREAYLPIRKRGHDAQLHLHPVFHYYHLVSQGRLRRDQLPPQMDLIGSLPLETQVELLQHGLALFQDLLGTVPVAFRAGCYGASFATLDALARVGIGFDSSFNPAYLGSTCLMDGKSPTNVPWRNRSVWEFPVTTFETGAWKMRGLKPLEVSAVSLWEMQRVLEQAERLGQRTVIVMLHSFGFLKRADVQFRRMRPDRIVIRRFRGLCAFLRRYPERFRVTTFSELPGMAVPVPQQDLPLPRMGSLVPAARRLAQAVNRFYWI